MKNPCKECLLVNNCTALCEEKTNLSHLLSTAITNYLKHGNFLDKNQVTLFNKYKKLDKENREDIATIHARTIRLKL